MLQARTITVALTPHESLAIAESFLASLAYASDCSFDYAVECWRNGRDYDPAEDAQVILWTRIIDKFYAAGALNIGA